MVQERLCDTSCDGGIRTAARRRELQRGRPIDNYSGVVNYTQNCHVERGRVVGTSLMAEEITLTRQDLYDRAWTTPLQHLAKDFGVSDVGLAKICRSPSDCWSA